MLGASITSASRTCARTLPRLCRTALAATALVAMGCDETEVPDAPEENPEAASWRTEVTSDDAAVRAAAVDKIPGAPGDDGLGVLEQLALADPDARVREQATLAYAHVARTDGVSLLKDVALGDTDEDVVSAALASIERLRDEAAEPPRAWLDVDFPNQITPGEELAVKVRFGSSEAAPKAMLQLRLPEGFELASPGAHQWRGPIEAGAANEVVFRAVAPRRPVLSGARVRLSVDYPELLDLEVLQEQARVALDDSAGRFEPHGAPVRRAP
mgnify:CR=1 FL=1